MSEGRLEVQGIVSAEDDMPYVQFRQIEDGEVVAAWKTPPVEAREISQHILEAAMNATYDAAIVSWAKEVNPDNEEEARDMSARMLTLIRKHRSDIWGLPDQPEDWRG